MTPGTPRTISFKPSFLGELGQLPANYQAQVMAKVGMLSTDPEPDAKTRKRLKGVKNGLCRLRSGDYRIFYGYDKTSVSLFSVRLRSEGTYDSLPDAEELEHGDFQVPTQTGPTQEDFLNWITPKDQSTPLPEPVTIELLEALGVPQAYHGRLCEAESQEAVLECPGVPDEFLLAVDQHMFEKPIERIVQEPTLIAPGGVDDLLRFTEGKLVTFLLELDPEQEKYVSWALEAGGPTLVRGGPGTGKTTVAIYRAREMIRVLREAGRETPRVLFTTYTNALVTFSQQLLEFLLGEDVKCVDVRTADSVVGSVLGRAGEGSQRPGTGERLAFQKAAWEKATFQGNAIQQAAQKRALDRLGREYVFEEIEVVIQGRDLQSLREYQEAKRPGRRVSLNESSRRAVWAMHLDYARELLDGGVETWQQARARAAAIVARGETNLRPYDAVIVDEAQDLDASSIRLLVDLCTNKNRLFLTADESQSIHAAGFSWKDVHERLRFEGRTGVLTSNHRSTEEIIEAARDYLAAGLAEELTPDSQIYAHNGPAPAVRSLPSQEEEADLLARYLRGATREFRLTIGSGAVLVPHKSDGRRIAEALEVRGVPALFQDSRHFELDDNTVKVLPLKAAKGLEFPVVAVAGFIGSTYPDLPTDADPDAFTDLMVRERRTLFVAMTRAMRALLVVTPRDDPSVLFDGFDPEFWNTGAS